MSGQVSESSINILSPMKFEMIHNLCRVVSKGFSYQASHGIASASSGYHWWYELPHCHTCSHDHSLGTLSMVSLVSHSPLMRQIHKIHTAHIYHSQNFSCRFILARHTFRKASKSIHHCVSKSYRWSHQILLVNSSDWCKHRSSTTGTWPASNLISRCHLKSRPNLSEQPQRLQLEHGINLRKIAVETNIYSTYQEPLPQGK